MSGGLITECNLDLWSLHWRDISRSLTASTDSCLFITSARYWCVVTTGCYCHSAAICCWLLSADIRHTVNIQQNTSLCVSNNMLQTRKYCVAIGPHSVTCHVRYFSVTSYDVTLEYVTQVHHASLQVTHARWPRCHGGRGFTLVMWRNYVVT